MSQEDPQGLRLVASFREAYTNCLNPEGGFLPPVVPAQALPEPWQAYVRSCLELPQHYHGSNAHVRPWLDERVGAWDPAWAGLVEGLGELELNTLMTVLSTLGHAYRWDSAPPRHEEYQRTRIDLPAGLSEPWALVARRLGVPRVGSLYHLVLNNWRLRSRPNGGPYTNAEVAGDNLEFAYPYLLPPADQQARAFFASIIESEARGALALRTIAGLLLAVAHSNAHETVYLLDKLRAEIQDIGRVFGIYIRKQVVTADTFLTLIQPTHVWGLNEGTGPLDGASGSQAPILQALDAALGLKRQSHTGQAVLKGRQYLLPAHRRFLATLDEASAVVRTFVDESADPQMTELFNECVKGVQLWRRMHQKRGALYLKGDTEGSAPDYASVGKTVTTSEDRVRVFEDAMQERLQETTGALFPIADEGPATVENAFQYLTAADRERLLACSRPRSYAAGETILERGSRRQGIFIVRSGSVRVVSGGPHGPLAVAYLGEGEVFGEMSYLENQGASSSVLAAGPCTVDVIEREHVYGLLGSVPGLAGRFFQSLATLLSRRLRRTNVLLEQSFERRPAARPHLRRTGRLGGEPLPPEARRHLDSFAATLHGVEQALAKGGVPAAEAEARVSTACDALLELLRRCDAEEDASAGVLDVIFREAFPWIMQSELADRLFHLPPGCSLDQATLECLRRPTAGGDGRVGRLVDHWCRGLPTVRSLREAPARLATVVRRLAGSWADPAGLSVTGLGPGSAGYLPDVLATTDGPRLQFICVDPDGDAVARGAGRAQALGTAECVQFIQDDILRLAWTRTRPMGPQQVILADTLFHHLSNRDAVAVLDWVHASLRTGGVAIVASLAPTSLDRPFFDHILNWGVVRRDADDVSDLFTRSAFGADPVHVDLDEAGVTLYATCTKR
ncbi:MAG TPA: cyclic nucleotide-binding domain-containing protein [Gemmataceae bacterium]|nr:cyclic nucleotide-binding domain-containing protein [Gemmataceae bacterium]